VNAVEMIQELVEPGSVEEWELAATGRQSLAHSPKL
jgi:hypothetical protein